MCVVRAPLDAINPVDGGEKSNKKNSPFAGACLSVCLFWALAGAIIHVDCQSPSLYNSIHSSCSSGENKRERERETSGILGAYAAGLMILILILFLYVPKNRSPGRWVQCPLGVANKLGRSF